MPQQTRTRFSCSWVGCTKSYTTKASLAEHTRTHTDTRIKCPEPSCQYDAAKVKTLSDHREMMHPTPLTKACICQWTGCVHRCLSKNMRRHEEKCRFRPNVWNGVPEKELPGGVRVNLFDFRDGSIDIRPSQFGEEVENLPAKWRMAVEDRNLQQQAIVEPSLEVTNPSIDPVVFATNSMLEQQAIQQPVVLPMGFNPMVATDATLPQMGYYDMEAAQFMWPEMGNDNNMLSFTDDLAQMANNMMMPTEGTWSQMADNNNTVPTEDILAQMANFSIGTPEEMLAQMGFSPLELANDNYRAYQDPFSMAVNEGFHHQPVFNTNDNYWAL